MQFIPSAVAEPGPIFPSNEAIEPVYNRENPVSKTLLMNMTLATKPIVLDATIPTVSRGNPIAASPYQRFSVFATYLPEPRYGNGDTIPDRVTLATAPRSPLFFTNSATYTKMTQAPVRADFASDAAFAAYQVSVSGFKFYFDAIDEPADGSVRWQQDDNAFLFSKNDLKIPGSNPAAYYQGAALVKIELPGVDVGGQAPRVFVPVPLSPDKGDGSGTVG